MKVVWSNEPSVTTSVIMEQLGKSKKWKGPTITAFMQRLIYRGFLRTEKNSKERIYYPLIGKEEYLRFETEHFIKLYHENSFLSLINALSDNTPLDKDAINELIQWIRERG